MKLAVFNPNTGAAVRLLSNNNPDDVAASLAGMVIHYGFPSRILDGTPYAYAAMLENLPLLADFDAEVGNPQSFEAP